MSLADAHARLLTALDAHEHILEPLGRMFSEAGRELALVGGSVRDGLLGRPMPDLDFTTDADPDAILAIVNPWADAVWEIGRAFGTIGLLKDDLQIEITTYRAEAYDPDSRKPTVAFGDNLDDDLVRRDFTIGAMAVRLPDRVFVDPFGGLADLTNGLVRTPGKAVDSFSDDPLRMMRAARFVSQLGFAVDDEVREAMTAMAERIDIISAERVRDELVKLICGARPRAGIELLVETGIAERILPEITDMQLERDEHHRHKDVYQHSLTVLDQAVDLEAVYAARQEKAAKEKAAAATAESETSGTTTSGTAPEAEGTEAQDAPAGPVTAIAEDPQRITVPDFIVRFAALMHDIGKPSTRRFTPDGAVTFYHHDVVGAKMTRKRMKALRFDKATTKAVSRLVELHLRFYGYGDAGWTDSAVRRYVTDAGELLTRLHILTRSDVTTRNRRKAERLAHAYDDLEHRIEKLAEREKLDAVRPDLDGRQIMDILGISPGPAVGQAYQYLLAQRMEHGPLGQQRAEEVLRQWWAEQDTDA